MTCEMTHREQRLDDFLLRKLSEPEAEAFEIHVFGCADCLQELRMREQMIMLMQEERATVSAAIPRLAKPREGFLRKIADFFSLRPNVWIYAGVAATLLVGFFIAQLLRRQEPPDIYAANFVELPHLESRVGQAFRSGDFPLSVISPQIGENFTGEIFFRWEIKKDEKKFSGPLELKILDNRENLVHTATVESGQYNLKENLAPGIYYWTLDYQGETLYVGKFFVKKPKK